MIQLAYTSERSENCTDAQLDAILASSQKNNLSSGITGILLFSSTHFIQMLEGDGPEIDHLYKTIQSDPRHQNVTLMWRKTISERQFPAWSMQLRNMLSLGQAGAWRS